MTRVLFMSDGSDIAVACAKSVARRNIDVVGLVIGPNVTPAEAEAILSCWSSRPPVIQSARPDLDPQIIQWAEAGELDLLLSIFFEYRVRPFLLDHAKMGGINIHPSLLPNNGGFHTSFWGIVNQTPFGATLMWMDEGLDTGGVIAQKRFDDDGVMSANDVRTKQRQFCAELFEENVDALIAGRIPHTKGQPCSYHFKKDIIAATTFDEDDMVNVARLMRLGRATGHGENGLTVRMHDGRRYQMRISVHQLPPEDPSSK